MASYTRGRCRIFKKGVQLSRSPCKGVVQGGPGGPALGPTLKRLHRGPKGGLDPRTSPPRSVTVIPSVSQAAES